jgi:predicted Rossmann-fold nucleotide-binding protein
LSLSVCIFCGSSFGDAPHFATVAREAGTEIARRGWTLVYGGARVGLMGVVADAALAAGGRVVGVIPRFLYEREVGHDGVSQLEVVSSLTERKLRMGELSDAFLSVGLQHKPSGLLNVAGYYDGLVAFLERATAAGFVKPQHRRMLAVSADVGELLDGFSAALDSSHAS